MQFTTTAIALMLMLPGAALAQEAPKPDQTKPDQTKQEPEKRRDGTLDKAGTIATQPARDIGLDKDEIPPVLLKAVDNPYAAPPSRTCKGLKASLAELNAVLGEDFTIGAKANENRTGKIAEAVGKTIVNSLIPFRGLVREISGAAPAERRLQAAVTAGVARRGYLRGYAAAKGCKVTN
ncbi:MULTISPECIES: hypothetical protein [Sphingobium]|uniref:Uncharacterized protein n=1 Tax=Sphingobium cupriresistens TaxID=1132417 RepID=A0A8G1ZLB0_9SPHN|nr:MULTISPECIES: hypothetical protein [Sphingobium]RYM10306.1 hypothetical protein EWH12_12000 [Sphingobium cupriresistens]WCP13248.1 hypothetical protein sphantq_01667 [Sphingobium sp. AntQ-1]